MASTWEGSVGRDFANHLGQYTHPGRVRFRTDPKKVQPAKSEGAGASAMSSRAAVNRPSVVTDAIFAMAFEWLMSVSSFVCLKPRWGGLCVMNTF